ncbi:MAG: hypothetical protein A2X12_06320 [Bacteroidetes bacterium GWE2_29_8]|nr:MAG: hypothetical protein A2X12_06320 [Bacteroidetes bacterium GWE2_29_8]OFY21219.1 MAG: hypothetical protein A2X02_10400 [Bacteroidetes bacterium GWF2_29_10]
MGKEILKEKQEERLIAFFDILGFKELIEKYEDGQNELLDNISEAISETFEQFEQLKKFHMEFSRNSILTEWLNSVDKKVFSDNFCISVLLESPILNMPKHYNEKFFFQYISMVQENLMKKEYFVRGAITYGSYYSDDNIIFSSGLVEAYKLESEVAIYPRIIISDKLVEYLKRTEFAYYGDLLIDNCGIVLLNPFNWDLVDSKIADIEMENRLINQQGHIENSFEEESQKEKQNKLEAIKLIVENKKEKYKENVKTRQKYGWLLNFIDSELNNGISENKMFKKANFK